MARARTQARIDAAKAAEAEVAPQEPAGEQVYRNIGRHKVNGVEPGGIVELSPDQARRLLGARHVELVDAAEVEEDVQQDNPSADDTAGHSPEVESE